MTSKAMTATIQTRSKVKMLEDDKEDDNANCDEWLKSSFHNDNKNIKKEEPEITEAQEVEDLSATYDSSGLDNADIINPIVSPLELSPRCNDKSRNSAKKQNDNATDIRVNTPTLALDQVLSLLKQVADEVQAEDRKAAGETMELLRPAFVTWMNQDLKCPIIGLGTTCMISYCTVM